MPVITGYVEKIWKNAKPAANGKKAYTSYAVVVDNVKYGTFTAPECAEGDFVSFNANQNGNYWNLDNATLKKATPPTDKQSPANVPTGYGGGKSVAVQDAINYQSARKDALVFVEILASQQLLDLGKTKGRQIDVLEIFLDKYTTRFFEDTKNLGHKLEEAAAEGVAQDPEDEIPY